MNGAQHAIVVAIVALVVMAVVYFANPIAPQCGPAIPRWAGIPALLLAAYMILPLSLAGTDSNAA